jgi:FkbM family methyltransferase
MKWLEGSDSPRLSGVNACKREWDTARIMLNEVRRIMRRLRGSVNYTSTHRINGKTFRVPRIYGMKFDAAETWMLGALQCILPLTDGAFLDVGVNVGQTLLKVRAIDSTRPYVGFEPNPMCVLYVQELVKENGFEGCTVIPAGLFTSDGVLPLNRFQHDHADSSASLIVNFRHDAAVAVTLVPVYRWETIAKVARVQKVGVVKIDVEGAELEVVQTLNALVSRDRPVILLEVLPAYSESNTLRVTRQLELERNLRGLDYALLRIQKSQADQYTGLTAIDAIGIHQDLNLCDYVAAPLELVPSLLRNPKHVFP